MRNQKRKYAMSRVPRNYVVCLYGRIRPIGKVVAYCNAKHCYLQPKDITEKGCNRKHCKYLQQLNKDKTKEEIY